MFTYWDHWWVWWVHWGCYWVDCLEWEGEVVISEDFYFKGKCEVVFKKTIVDVESCDHNVQWGVEWWWGAVVCEGLCGVFV